MKFASSLEQKHEKTAQKLFKMSSLDAAMYQNNFVSEYLH